MSHRILLSAEGKRDVGGIFDPVYGDPKDDGFLQPLIRRALDANPTFIGDHSLSLGIRPPKSLKGKLVQRAHRAVALADVKDCCLVVVHTDADERATKDRPPAGCISRTEHLRAGVDAAGDGRPPAILAVPIATTESWALGDADCVRDLGVTDDPALNRDPETLWGKPHEPSSNHPKCLLERVLGRAASHRVQAQIAETMDIEAAANRCPRSLRPFLYELRAANSGLTTARGGCPG